MDERKFWAVMDRLDWKHEGNDKLVVKPVVDCLAEMSDQEIFAFDEILAKLLYDIDGQAWYDDEENLSGDSFLYARCVAVVNGRDYYYAVKRHETALRSDLEFEAALYLPEQAWAQKHGREAQDYPHHTALSFESFENKANWPHLNQK